MPVDLAHELAPHQVDTVTGLGWQGVANGELLRRTTGNYEALVTMDRNIEFQQPLAKAADRRCHHPGPVESHV
ncbi:MAG: hypothetical protein ACRERX_05565 [Pseudomonas sp.]